MIRNKGFTLIELLIVVVIFSVVIGSSTGVFASALRIQRYNLSQQQLLNQISYVSEYMSRMIRMAVVDDGTCGFSGQNYKITGSKIEFQNYLGECQEFYLSTGQILVDRTGYSSPVPLTSDDFTVSDLQFISVGILRSDSFQPKITFSMRVTSDIVGDAQPLINIQTTISQRNLDIN